MEQQKCRGSETSLYKSRWKITGFLAAMGEDIDELNRLNSSEAESGANDHQADKKAGTTGLARKSPYCCPNSQVI